MVYNLIVAYDLIRPGQNYESIRERINEVGSTYWLQQSVVYVNTAMTPDQAYKHVSGVMDVNDKLLVVGANRLIADPLPAPALEAINAVWFGDRPQQVRKSTIRKR